MQKAVPMVQIKQNLLLLLLITPAGLIAVDKAIGAIGIITFALVYLSKGIRRLSVQSMDALGDRTR